MVWGIPGDVHQSLGFRSAQQGTCAHRVPGCLAPEQQAGGSHGRGPEGRACEPGPAGPRGRERPEHERLAHDLRGHTSAWRQGGIGGEREGREAVEGWRGKGEAGQARSEGKRGAQLLIVAINNSYH